MNADDITELYMASRLDYRGEGEINRNLHVGHRFKPRGDIMG